MKAKRNWIIAVAAVLLVLAGLYFFSGRVQEPGSTAGTVCIDQCGNGTCEEMVCMAVGCPCAETASTCPKDCAVAR
ncbi:MAG: hypothetical protein ACRETN_14710 [Nevskiales bacterium]